MKINFSFPGLMTARLAGEGEGEHRGRARCTPPPDCRPAPEALCVGPAHRVPVPARFHPLRAAIESPGGAATSNGTFLAALVCPLPLRRLSGPARLVPGRLAVPLLSPRLSRLDNKSGASPGGRTARSGL